jgi:hypothetical protein
LLNRLRLCLARTRLREIQRSPGLFKTGAATGGYVGTVPQRVYCSPCPGLVKPADGHFTNA